MKNKLIRVGVIGLGVGEAHIQSYKNLENVEVKSICDTNVDKLKKIKKKYDIDNIYTDYQKIVLDHEIDIVSICSYDNFHYEQILSSLRHGKNVMVEKPAVLFPNEAEKIIKELAKTNLKMSSNLILRKSPRFMYVNDLVKKGDLGEIFHIEGDYLHNILQKIIVGWRGRMDFYCTVYGGGIHLIDLMRWIMNDEIQEVCAVGTSIPTQRSSYKWPDTITSLFKWKGGATGKSTTSFAPMRTKFHSLNIYGTKKTFLNDMPYAKFFKGDNENTDEEMIKDPYPGMLKGDLLPSFVDCVRKNKKPLINEIDIFRVMSVCFAIWQSVKLKKTVKVENII